MSASSQHQDHRCLWNHHLWLSLGDHQPPSSWTLELLDPPFLVQKPLPLGGLHAFVRQKYAWERAWARGRGLKLGLVPRTGMGNWDRGPNTTVALAPPPGLIVHTSLPRPPKIFMGKGGSEGRVSTPAFYSLPLSQLGPGILLGAESSSSLLHSLSLPAVKLKRSHCASRASCTERGSLLWEPAPEPLPLPVLSIPLNGHSQCGWHGMGHGTSTVCLRSSPGTASRG